MTVLNDEQAGRFFDTMDALLYFVNERFRVVEGFTLDYEGQIGDMKASLVAHALWDNVEVIDDFVRENPMRLPRACLETARAWKTALPGVFTVVRYQGGRALVMNDVGVFSVGGVTLEIEGEIGPAPAYVEMVLLPFDDGIVYDGFLQAFDGDGSAEEATRIQDEFENRCSGGIIATAAEFSQVVGAHLAAKRDEELEALLADVAREAVGGNEVLPAGFHRGALADRDGGAEDLPGLSDGPSPSPYPLADTRALDCAIACAIWRGIVELGDAYEQYRALVPEPLPRAEFEEIARFEGSHSDAFFGIWSHDGSDYLMYYSLTPDYVAQAMSQAGDWRGLREELDYYERYRCELLETRREMQPKPLPRTLLENTPLGELLHDESAERLRRFLNERIPDGEDDLTFADAATQEFVLTSIESGSLEATLRLADELGLTECCADETRLPRLITNVFNAMPSWENNGWSPQELYEQLTGRRMFYNEDGTVKKVGADDPCPCGSGEKYRNCCGR